jgi:CBS domain-containing protein
MTFIKDTMTATCTWVSPEISVADAAKIMRDLDIGCVPVGENDRLIGTLTDRDIVTRVIASKRDATEIPVRDAMSKKLLYCFEDQTVDDIVQNMAAMQIRRLPVVNRQKRLVGMVSFADLAKAATPDLYAKAQAQIAAKPQKVGIKAANQA